MTYNEDDYEVAALEWFEEIGWSRAYGPEISPGGPAPERSDFGQVLLLGRLEAAIRLLNPGLDEPAVQQVIKVARRAESADLVRENLRWHTYFKDGVPIEVRDAAGNLKHLRPRIIDLRDPSNNDYLVVNQFRVVEPTGKRRADVVAFINGMPIGIFELKRPSDEDATIQGAWNQMECYREEIPSLLAPSAINVIADGANAWAGALDSSFEFYRPWRTVSTEKPVDDDQSQLKTLIHGMFDQNRVLELIEFYIDWGDYRGKLIKRIAMYQQYWGVRASVENVVRATAEGGDRRAGIVFHGQGSGKSMELLLAANILMRMPEMASPTIVVLSDRNDLDNQIYQKELGPSKILPEPAVPAKSRDDLRKLLDRAGGGIIVTTIHKFALPAKMPRSEGVITERRNVIVMADEAHRTQYGLIDGLAADMRTALPNATYLGFTGTPVELADRSTTGVFGDVISEYLPQQAIKDGTTVPIYYESRVAKIRLSQESERLLTAAVDELTEDISEAEQRATFAQWARIEAILSSEPVVDLIVDDVLTHWDKRRNILHGKAMLVTMSRSIAARCYEKIIAKRPDWHSDDDAKGRLKVAYTGSAADSASIRKHVRTDEQIDKIKGRAQNPDDELELVIVCDLWLTGFDSPALHTMYLAKLMKGHGLFQAITRPNRRYKDKPAGLIVSYVPVMDALKAAIGKYSRGQSKLSEDLIEEAVKQLLAEHDVVKGILAGHAWVSDAGTAAKRHDHIQAAASYLAHDKDKDERFADHVLKLIKLYCICGASDEAGSIRTDVEFFAAVRASRVKLTGDDPLGKPSREQRDSAMQQLIDGAIEADEIIDVYADAGRDKPDVSLLSAETIARITSKPDQGLQIALLQKIIKGQISSMRRTNRVRSIQFAKALASAVQRYENQTLSDAEIILVLVEVATGLRGEPGRAADKGLCPAEMAFYDAVRENGSAIQELGDETLKTIAQQLVIAIRSSATLDWRDRESVQAELRIKVKTLLKKYKYPPDGQEQATELILEQAELFTEDMLAA